jgi:hypothetical protein
MQKAMNILPILLGIGLASASIVSQYVSLQAVNAQNVTTNQTQTTNKTSSVGSNHTSSGTNPNPVCSMPIFINSSMCKK